MLKFIYSEKATKFCEISTVDLSYVVLVKSTVEISKNFVAFSEYMNFKEFDPIISLSVYLEKLADHFLPWGWDTSLWVVQLVEQE